MIFGSVSPALNATVTTVVAAAVAPDTSEPCASECRTRSMSVKLNKSQSIWSEWND